MRRIWSLFTVILVVLIPAWCWAISQSGTVVMEFDLSGHDRNEEAKLWVPYPVSDRNQLISDIEISGDYAESAVYTDQFYSTPMLYARWDEGAESRKLTLRFHVVRLEVSRRNFPDREVAWNPGDYGRYLAPSSLGPVDGQVKALADEITKGKTTVQGRARAIYDWICDNMHRDPDTRGCGRGDVCSLLVSRGGKCTDIHSVFVALCRAVGVPAREIFGVRLGREDGQDITRWQHCWAEFFLPGYDWVPVDPADVLKKMLKENLAPDDAKTREYRDYFWGGWDAYRVQLSTGRDLLLNPPQQGKALNNLGYPYAQIGTTTLDWHDPENFKYSFTFQK